LHQCIQKEDLDSFLQILATKVFLDPSDALLLWLCLRAAVKFNVVMLKYFSGNTANWK